MKKYLFFLFITAAALALTGSCTKDNPEEYPEPVGHEHFLVHVDARPHTDTENGCMEHWKCVSCGETFADAQGKVRKPMVIEWADNAIICEEDILKSFNGHNEKFETLKQSMIHNESNSSFAASLLASIIVKSLFEIMDRAFDYTHTEVQDPSGKIIYVINEKFMEVMKGLGEIQRSIDALSANIKNQTYKNAMQRRYEEQIALYNATDATLRQIVRLCGNKRFDELSEEELDGVETLLNMWYLAPVKGNNVITEVMNMLDASLMTFDTGLCYPEIYDKVAYQAYAFEHMGYDMRETVRCVDALSIAESYLMSCMWFQLHGGDRLFSERLQSLNEKLLKYSELLNAHQVKRVTEYTVSQVNGFHEGRKLSLKFKNCKDPCDYIDSQKESIDWRKISDDNYKTSSGQVQFKNISEGVYKHMAGEDELATREEYHTLWEFYGGRKAIEDIFKEAGFECTPYILSYHEVSDFRWHHLEYNGFRINESGRWYDMYIDMIQRDGTCPGSNIFVNSCSYNPDNGHLTLGNRQTITYSYPEWWLF